MTIGGYTRLTDSGLSIVEWTPIAGILPPLDRAQWQREFENYQRYPESQTVNPRMTLDGFKRIFWIEYVHRLVARLIAVAFLLPYAFFLVRGWIGRPLAIKLAAVFVLGGMQGALGWYMVQSGLIDDPAVSQYRLTAHLGLALFLYGVVLWLATGLLANASGRTFDVSGALRLRALLCIGLVAIMLASGGFMAGTRAGYIFNTFPLMDGTLVPEGLAALQPAWRNLFENTATIQFMHRWTAVLAVGAAAWLWLCRGNLGNSLQKRMLDIVLALALAQFALGVSALLSRVAIPVALAHQFGFVCLLTALIALLRVSWGRTQPA